MGRSKLPSHTKTMNLKSKTILIPVFLKYTSSLMFACMHATQEQNTGKPKFIYLNCDNGTAYKEIEDGTTLILLKDGFALTNHQNRIFRRAKWHIQAAIMWSAFLQLAQTVLPTIYSLITLHLIYRFITKFICLTTSSVQPTKIGRFLQYQTIVTKFITSKSIPNAKVQNHWMGGYQLIHQYESRLATVALVVEWNVVPTHDGICTKLRHMNDLLHKLGKKG